jgi:hypothetical protein
MKVTAARKVTPVARLFFHYGLSVMLNIGAGHTYAQQAVEEGMIICYVVRIAHSISDWDFRTRQWSVIGSSVGWGLTRTRKITELGCGCASLVLD